MRQLDVAFEDSVRDLALQLFEIDAIKFGCYEPKIGTTAPVYFDLRVVGSYPDVIDLIARLLLEISQPRATFDHLCGIPYTALPIATLISHKTRKPMLIRRKERKIYGTKNQIEGHFRPGDRCLVVEDVVISGASVLETVTDLRKEGLTVTDAVVVLDGEQGGVTALRRFDVVTTALFTMSTLVRILFDEGKICKNRADTVLEYIRAVKLPTGANAR